MRLGFLFSKTFVLYLVMGKNKLDRSDLWLDRPSWPF